MKNSAVKLEPIERLAVLDSQNFLCLSHWPTYSKTKANGELRKLAKIGNKFYLNFINARDSCATSSKEVAKRNVFIIKK